MLGQHIEKDQLCFHIGNRLIKRDDDRRVIGRFDAGKMFGVGRQVGKVDVVVVKVVGEGDIVGR